eukprot:GHRR01032495.1.p1 GENE.GHRR01032495.1~~GHRR01032495.1.p1  ORF type:complete len:115 (-),score=50.73 GHRR01032495.1:54-398(-)
MVVNGLATGRSTFFDLVHPTSTKEAAAHAHAAIGSTSSTSSSTTGMPGVAAAVGAPSAATSTSGSSGGGAAPALGRAPSQPVAITGVSVIAGVWYLLHGKQRPIVPSLHFGYNI